MKRLLATLVCISALSSVFGQDYQLGAGVSKTNNSIPVVYQVRNSGTEGAGVLLLSANDSIAIIAKGDTLSLAHPDTAVDFFLLTEGDILNRGDYKYWDGDSWELFTGGGGSGTLDEAYDFGGAGAGRTITADAGAVWVSGEDGFIVTGTFGSGDTSQWVGAGTGMFFNPKKAAFRYGTTSGTQWNDANIGEYSLATGENPIASGYSSYAMGEDCQATGDYSYSFGINSVASSESAIAIGIGCQATGSTSFAIGNGAASIGDISFATGTSVNSESYAETAIGLYNTDYTPTSTGSWGATDRLFVIGNGVNSGSRSDALVMLKNGNTGLGTSTPDTTLHVVGKMKYEDGTQGDGYVLTSDADGMATWTDAATLDFSAVPSYADNTAAEAVLGAGKLYYTDVAGEYMLKVTH